VPTAIGAHSFSVYARETNRLMHVCVSKSESDSVYYADLSQPCPSVTCLPLT